MAIERHIMTQEELEALPELAFESSPKYAASFDVAALASLLHGSEDETITAMAKAAHALDVTRGRCDA
jgi:hypothetical protein